MMMVVDVVVVVGRFWLRDGGSGGKVVAAVMR